MEIKKIDFDTEAEWLEHRKGYISSTEAAPLLSAGKWCSYFKLWHLKNGSLEDDFKENEDVFWGKILEPAIGQGFALQNNCTVEPYKTYHYRDDIKIGASYDFIITSGIYEGYILETKKMRSLAMKDWDDEVPLQYQVQCNHQLSLMPEAKGVIIAGLVDGGKLETWSVTRNEKIISLVEKKAVEFWKSIEEGIAPDIDLEDAETVIKLNQSANDSVIESTEEMEALATELTELAAAIKNAEKRQKEIKALLMSSTESAKVKLADGRTLDMGVTAGSAGKLITADMAGQFIGARSPFRRCQFRGKAKV